MRIVFFGSSHGVPDPNKRCSSTLIEVGQNRYFIDMGTQSIEQLITRNMPVESVRSIFITHMHGDHTNGLLSFLDLCSWYFKKANPIVYLPEPVEPTVAAIQNWIRCNNDEPREFSYRPVQAGVIYEDESIRVTAYPTKHIRNSYAFLVEAEGKRVLFSGDLCHHGPQEDFPMAVLDQPLDLAVCESAHFEATAYLPLFKGNTNLKKLCINHFSSFRLASVLELQKAFTDIPVLRAEDGMEITL